MPDHEERLEGNHHFVIFHIIAHEHQEFLGSHDEFLLRLSSHFCMFGGGRAIPNPPRFFPLLIAGFSQIEFARDGRVHGLGARPYGARFTIRSIS